MNTWAAGVKTKLFHSNAPIAQHVIHPPSTRMSDHKNSNKEWEYIPISHLCNITNPKSPSLPCPYLLTHYYIDNNSPYPRHAYSTWRAMSCMKMVYSFTDNSGLHFNAKSC